MKIIYRIAKSELNTLFCSPIAWLVLVIFTFQMSSVFSERVIWYLRELVTGHNSREGLTVYFLISGFGEPLYKAVLSYLYLYFPLLTMTLMSREYSSGSIKLLYSSPITSMQIVLGKFFSMLLYGLLILAIVAVYVVFYACVLENFDYATAFTGLLGIYLLIALYSAVGLFISSLTSYQVVAAIGTFAAFSLLNVIGGTLQGVDFWRDITHWLSMGTHGAIAGLISSNDVLYYVLMSILFLGLTVLKLRFARQYKPWYLKAIQYIALVVVILALGYWSSRPKNMWIEDYSCNEQLTLTPKSQEILAQFEGKLTLTTYVNILDEHMAPMTIPRSRNGDLGVFGKYVRFKPDIEFKYVYFYDELLGGAACCTYEDLEDAARKQAKAYGMDFEDVLSPEEIRLMIDLTDERNQVVRVLEDEEGNQAYLRMYNDLARYPGEQEISVALMRMKEGAVRMGVLRGHGEREIDKDGDREIGYLFTERSNRNALINQGFDILDVPLTEDMDFPEDLDMLIVSDMREALNEAEFEKLKKYIDEGGNMVILTDVNREKSMGALLAEFGVKAQKGTLVCKQEDYVPTSLFTALTPEAGTWIPSLARWTNGRLPLMMSGAVALDCVEDKGFQVIPFAVTSQDAWNELETVDFVNEIPELNGKAGEKQASYPVALALTKNVDGKEQRILIFGDADWMTAGEFGKNRNFGTVNAFLTTDMSRWMVYDKYPTYFPRPSQPDNVIKLDYSDRKAIQTVFVVIFPAIILLLYFWVWYKRRGK